MDQNKLTPRTSRRATNVRIKPKMPSSFVLRDPLKTKSTRIGLRSSKYKTTARSDFKQFSPIDESFCETEVRDFEVAARIEEKIFWLEVSVDDGLGVEIFEDENQLARVEQGRGIAEMTGISQVGEQLSTRHVLKEEVKKRRVVTRAQSVKGDFRLIKNFKYSKCVLGMM